MLIKYLSEKTYLKFIIEAFAQYSKNNGQYTIGNILITNRQILY